MEWLEITGTSFDIYIKILALAIAAFGVSLVITFLIRSALRPLRERLIIDELLMHLTKPVRFLLPLLLFQLALPFSQITLTENSLTILQSLIIIGITGVLMAAVNILTDILSLKLEIGKADNIRERKAVTQIIFVKRLLHIILVIIGIAVILWNIDEARKFGQGILASAGVAGLIIGFAAQKSLGNLIAGFQIAFTQPIRMDDVVIVENEWGKIEEITFTYVVVRIWDQRRLVLPINYFIEKPFQNWTRTSADIWGTVFLYMDYRIPIEELEKEQTRLLQETKYWDGKINVLQVTDATEKTMELRSILSARSSPDAWDLRCYIRRGLITFIQKNYPQYLPLSRVELSGDKEQK